MQHADEAPTAEPDERASPWTSLWGVLLLFLGAACVVNPFREMPYDDDWAFSETVKHLLDTGQYRLNEWLAPNMPFQTAWGALFCLPFGYSFSALRISTMVLAVIGLVAFRALAREHGLSRTSANLLTFCLASSPLIFKLTLTYLSDVPFLALTLVSILFYTRALRTGRWFDWVFASLVTSATIFIRQFGVAILGGLALVWLLDRRRFERFGQYFAGALLPIASTLFQLQQGWNHSNWAQTVLLLRQKKFFWGGDVLKGLPWRFPVLVEYSAFFLLPLVLVAVLAVRRRFRGRLAIELVCWLLLLLASVTYGALVLNDVTWLMPYLPWFFELLKSLGLKAEIPATVLTIAGGVLFAHFLSRRYRSAAERPTLDQSLLDGATLVSLLMAVIFFVFGDKDVLIFLPLVAIAVAKQTEDILLAHRGTVFLACLFVLAGAAVWTREDLCRNQAVWTLATRVEATGVPSEKIAAGWEWYGYHHFEDYVRANPPRADFEFKSFFGPGMEGQNAQAEYLIVHELKPPAGEHWETVDQFRYFSVFSRGIETFYAVRRVK
jgi:hypothetical protein